MNAVGTYLRSGRSYSYDGIIAVLDAEAATLDPDQWEGGWDARDYLIEAINTGVVIVASIGDEEAV